MTNTVDNRKKSTIEEIKSDSAENINFEGVVNLLNHADEDQDKKIDENEINGLLDSDFLGDEENIKRMGEILGDEGLNKIDDESKKGLLVSFRFALDRAFNEIINKEGIIGEEDEKILSLWEKLFAEKYPQETTELINFRNEQKKLIEAKKIEDERIAREERLRQEKMNKLSGYVDRFNKLSPTDQQIVKERYNNSELKGEDLSELESFETSLNEVLSEMDNAVWDEEGINKANTLNKILGEDSTEKIKLQEMVQTKCDNAIDEIIKYVINHGVVQPNNIYQGKIIQLAANVIYGENLTLDGKRGEKPWLFSSQNDNQKKTNLYMWKLLITDRNKVMEKRQEKELLYIPDLDDYLNQLPSDELKDKVWTEFLEFFLKDVYHYGIYFENKVTGDRLKQVLELMIKENTTTGTESEEYRKEKEELKKSISDKVQADGVENNKKSFNRTLDEYEQEYSDLVRYYREEIRNTHTLHEIAKIREEFEKELQYYTNEEENKRKGSGGLNNESKIYGIKEIDDISIFLQECEDKKFEKWEDFKNNENICGTATKLLKIVCEKTEGFDNLLQIFAKENNIEISKPTFEFFVKLADAALRKKYIEPWEKIKVNKFTERTIDTIVKFANNYKNNNFATRKDIEKDAVAFKNISYLLECMYGDGEFDVLLQRFAKESKISQPTNQLIQKLVEKTLKKCIETRTQGIYMKTKLINYTQTKMRINTNQTDNFQELDIASMKSKLFETISGLESLGYSVNIDDILFLKQGLKALRYDTLDDLKSDQKLDTLDAINYIIDYGDKAQDSNLTDGHWTSEVYNKYAGDLYAPGAYTKMLAQERNYVQNVGYTLSLNDYNKLFKNFYETDQGDLGDCYLISTIRGLARTEFFDTLIRTSVKCNNDGSYSVRLPLGEPKGKLYTITQSELRSARVEGADGYKILELAYIKCAGGIQKLNEEKINTAEASTGKNCLVRLLGTEGYDVESYGNYTNQAVHSGKNSLTQKEKEEVKERLKSFDPAMGDIISVDRWGFKDAKNFAEWHVQSVIDVQKNGKGEVTHVIVENPRNSTEKDSDGGTRKIQIDTFLTEVTHIHFASKNHNFLDTKTSNFLDTQLYAHQAVYHLTNCGREFLIFKDNVGQGWSWYKQNPVRGVVNFATSTVDLAGGLVYDAISSAFSFNEACVSGAFSIIEGGISKLNESFFDGNSKVLNTLEKWTQNAEDGVIRCMDQVGQGADRVVQNGVKPAWNAVKSGVDYVTSKMDEGINAVIGWFNN